MRVTLEPIDDFHHIKIGRSARQALDADTLSRIDAAWQGLCAQNPRYFNGPILVFDRFDAQSGVIHAHIDQYKHHAVRDSVDLGLSLLAVTACIARSDETGTQQWLLGKRSTKSHAYPGLWELGPSGGVEPPRFRRTISIKRLLSATNKETREEIGVAVKSQPATIRALVHDPIAGSTDVAIAIPFVTGTPSITTNWEYAQTRWVTLDELLAWCDEHPDEMIPTSIALARFLAQSRD